MEELLIYKEFKFDKKELERIVNYFEEQKALMKSFGVEDPDVPIKLNRFKRLLSINFKVSQKRAFKLLKLVNK